MRVLTTLTALLLVLPAAAQPAGPVVVLPPVTEVRVASRAYPVTAVASTNHAGWRESRAYANVAQDVKLRWHVDPGGAAELRGRDAWNPQAPWRDLGRWGRGTDEPQKGETTIAVTGPTLLLLRARAPKFPRSGVSRLRADYARHTVAALRGTAGERKRPVVIAEGYDPFNAADWNDAGWQEDPTLARLVTIGRERHNVDTWLLDWGDGAASLTEQAEDFTEIARQIREWNGGRRETVAAGVSMGAVTLRYALASAADAGENLGVRKYLSINGPHRGAWVNPGLTRFLIRYTMGKEPPAPEIEPGQHAVWRGLGSPAPQQLLTSGQRHDEFYTALRSCGRAGYHPDVERVAFSNGSLVREGNDLAELVEGHPEVVHRVQMRPLWLPFWVTVRKTRQRFRYGAYPGELLPESLRQPTRGHTKLLGFLRLDFRGEWESAPTFIPTHSALDFPDELDGGPERFRYTRWRESPFERIYVARGRNLAHDDTQADWIDPRTGRGAPEGQNAVLYEILEAFR